MDRRANRRMLLENRNAVSPAGELGGGGKPCGPTADDDHVSHVGDIMGQIFGSRYSQRPRNEIQNDNSNSLRSSHGVRVRTYSTS